MNLKLFCALSASAVCLLLARVVNASAAITIETVPVANPGNAADTRVMSDGSTGYGSVGYAYNVGRYDVTASQYTAFLNAVAATDTYGLYNSAMSNTASGGHPGIIQSGFPGTYAYSVVSGRGNRPMTDVSFWDACRFANWLQNGQPTGVAEGAATTETGTYTLTTDGINGNSITRNTGKTWAVTSEDEWYKAAYYDPTLNANAGGYWLYPTKSNVLSTAQANYTLSDTTDVGSYSSYPSYFGTYDQAGNAWEWNEAIVGSLRGLRGGAYTTGDIGLLQSSFRNPQPPALAYPDIGFRVVELVPEPASLGILGLGVVGMLVRRRRMVYG